MTRAMRGDATSPPDSYVGTVLTPRGAPRHNLRASVRPTHLPFPWLLPPGPSRAPCPLEFHTENAQRPMICVAEDPALDARRPPPEGTPTRAVTNRVANRSNEHPTSPTPSASNHPGWSPGRTWGPCGSSLLFCLCRRPPPAGHAGSREEGRTCLICLFTAC